MADRPPNPETPPHIADTVRLIAQMHVEHHRKASWTQRLVERATARIGRPAFAAAMTVVIAIWIGGNLAAMALGDRSLDPPPFPLLDSLVTIISLYIVVMLLSTQRREEELGRNRERMILELALLSEQKTTKIIQLLEESRRDNPLVHDRVDAEAEAMARPADAQSVLDTLAKSHEMATETVPPAEIEARKA